MVQWPAFTLRAGLERRHLTDVLAVLVLMAGVVLRLEWLLDARVAPVDDAAYYYQHAAEIAAGEGYVHPATGEPSAFLPPGYPLLLAAVFAVTGPSAMAAGVLNLVLAVTGLVLTFLLARKFFGAAAGVLAMAALAFFPSQVVYTPAVMPDILFTTLVMGVLYAALAHGTGRASTVATGILLGAAVLTAPKAILLLPALAVCWRNESPWSASLRRTALAGCAMLLVAFPWSVRSSIELGSPVFVATNSGVNLWAGNHDGASGGWEPWDPAAATWSAPEEEARTNSEFLRRGVQYAVSHPIDTVALWPEKLREAFSQDFTYLGHFSVVPRDRPLESTLDRGGLEERVHLYYSVFMTAALAGSAILLATRNAAGVLGWPAAALVLPILAFFGLDRFHLPLLPIFAVAVAGGAVVSARYLLSASFPGAGAAKPGATGSDSAV